jgi:hypothetical protein
MQPTVTTTFELAHDGQSLVEALRATVNCARGLPFYGNRLGDGSIDSLDDFAGLPLTSRVDLSMASGLEELITDPRKIFRSLYPFNQNTCTFPFQVVAGEQDLLLRHERMKALVASAGFEQAGETLILAGPPQFFFASDLCAEILFEGHHCSIQDVTALGEKALRARIEAFGAELVVLATDSPAVTKEAIPPSVRGLMTFRGAYPALGEVDARVVDVYGVTEVPYLGHRLAGERCYQYDKDQFFVERSPAGMVTITTLLWEVMPFVRYQSYDFAGEIDDEQGLFEVLDWGEW